MSYMQTRHSWDAYMHTFMSKKIAAGAFLEEPAASMHAREHSTGGRLRTWSPCSAWNFHKWEPYKEHAKFGDAVHQGALEDESPPNTAPSRAGWRQVL